MASVIQSGRQETGSQDSPDAQDPDAQDTDEQDTDEQDPDEQDPFETQIQRVFQAAANGEFPDGETGNIVLDDMLKVMRQTGPISSRLASSRGFDDLESPLDAKIQARSQSDQAEKTILARAKAAEQLLKAARLLEQQADQLPSAVSLVDEMRVTARELLTDRLMTQGSKKGGL